MVVSEDVREVSIVSAEELEVGLEAKYNEAEVEDEVNVGVEVRVEVEVVLELAISEPGEEIMDVERVTPKVDRGEDEKSNVDGRSDVRVEDGIVHKAVEKSESLSEVEGMTEEESDFIVMGKVVVGLETELDEEKNGDKGVVVVVSEEVVIVMLVADDSSVDRTVVVVSEEGTSIFDVLVVKVLGVEVSVVVEVSIVVEISVVGKVPVVNIPVVVEVLVVVKESVAIEVFIVEVLVVKIPVVVRVAIVEIPIVEISVVEICAEVEISVVEVSVVEVLIIETLVPNESKLVLVLEVKGDVEDDVKLSTVA